MALPAVADGPQREQKARAAVAGTFAAALELCRSGEVSVKRQEHFGSIKIQPIGALQGGQGAAQGT